MLYYLGFTFGFKWILIAVALVFGSRLQRLMMASFTALIILGTCFQFSDEVLTNHKFFNVWLVLMNVPVAFGEVYSAMKSGVVDGLELPYTQILNMKLNEVVKYVIADAHLFNQEMLFVNDKWFTGLTADQQKAVLHAARDAQAAGRGVALVSDAIGPASLREAGMIVYYPTEKEREQFKQATQPQVIEILKKRIDPKYVTGVLNAAAEASK